LFIMEGSRGFLGMSLGYW